MEGPPVALHAAALIRNRVEGLFTPGLDPEAVHDRRVAARRLRVACELFDAVLPEAGAKRLAKALKAFGSSLGSLRELDVHRGGLLVLRSQAHELMEQAALEHLLELVEDRRRKAAKKAKDAGRGLKALVRDLLDLADRLEACEAAAFSPTFIWSALQPGLREAYGPLQAHQGQEEPEAMHATRTRLKQLRYALECLEPAFQDGFASFLAQTKRLQEALGHHHDEVLLGDLVRKRLDLASTRGRPVLAEGLRHALQRTESRRQAFYRAFQSEVPGVSVDALAQSLWVSIDPLQGTPV